MISPPDLPEDLVEDRTVELAAAEPTRTSIGPYRLIEKVGAGGMGEIYLSEDPRLHRRVALKLLPAQFTHDRDRVRRFVQEAQAASALNHPNIITIFEIGEIEGLHYIVTEYIEGQTLRRLMAGQLTLKDALDVSVQVAGALKAAHEAGIIHRDIKPENVMVRPDGLVKLLDFGIAKLNDKTSLPKPLPVIDSIDDQETVTLEVSYAATPADPLNETTPGLIMGTVTYMPPELLRGFKVDARADIFSLGVVLYEVVAGSPPFIGSTQVDIISAILDREPAPLANYRPEMPPELETIVSKALKKDRDARYQCVEDMLADLTDLKKKSDFQAMLEQSSGQNRAVSDTADNSTLVLEAVDTGNASAQQTTSTAAIISNVIRKRSALLILAIIVAATAALAYLAYTRDSGSAGSDINSIAVLPFRNLSNDPEKEYLSDGISESLTNRLSQLPGLKVIANSSSARYKGKDTDPQEVADSLGVVCILTGRLSQRGDRLSISVELIDGRDRTHLWGEQYDRKATDLLQVQAEISGEIANKLHLRLTAGQQQFAGGETVKPEAYELLLKGRSHHSRGMLDDRKKAADYFNQAIAVDPDYAIAYAELSNVYWSLASGSGLDPKEYLLKAEAAALKALELDESLAEAHYALANLKLDVWEWADAEREYKRAIELNPNLALAHRYYALYLSCVNLPDQAFVEIQRARELDPLSSRINMAIGQLHLYAGQYEDAIEALKKTLELYQSFTYARYLLANAYTAKGMYREAIAAYQNVINMDKDTPSYQICLGAAYAKAGDREQAQKILKLMQASKMYVSPAEMAILYSALGEREQAFASLEKAYQARDLQLMYLGVSPGYDPLRSDPRFESLMRRVGLTR